MIYNKEEDSNVIAYNNQNKTDIIAQIENLINEYGDFGTSAIQADHSPCIPSYGNFIHLIEYFNFDNVEVNVYMQGGEIEIDNYTLPYENLTIDNLEYILELTKEWEEINLDNNNK